MAAVVSWWLISLTLPPFAQRGQLGMLGSKNRADPQGEFGAGAQKKRAPRMPEVDRQPSSHAPTGKQANCGKPAIPAVRRGRIGGMRYRLRTLLILLAVLPPLLWGVFALWLKVEAWRESQRARSGVVVNVPALGPQPIALDFGFPVASQDSPDAPVMTFTVG
jgi:hypothetical protein